MDERPTTEEVEQALERLLQRAREDEAVAGILQHGSSLGSGPHRDVDVTVVLRPSHAKPSQAKGPGLVYDGYVIGERGWGLDVSVFQDLPLYIQHRVLSDHVVLLERDRDALFEAARRSVRAWEDYRPHYEAYLEAVAARG